MNCAGVLAVTANQDQSGGQFLLLRPVIMRGGLDRHRRMTIAIIFVHIILLSFIQYITHKVAYESDA